MVVLGKFLHSIGGKLVSEGERVISLQREGDSFLMHFAQGSSEEVCAIQRCHLYMRAATLADVFIADGRALKESLVVGIPFNSKLDWTNQGKPHKDDWNIWKRFLKNLPGLAVGGAAPTGPWISF